MDASKFRLTYDAAEEIYFIEMDGVRLETKADIDACFEHVLSFWRKNCKGCKVYIVVCYDGFAVNLRENEYYAQRMKAASAVCCHTVVRYGGDALQRSAARLRGMKLHMPSNLYESRAEAIEVVRQIRVGRISIAPPG
jgi:hypothetical protein